MKFISLWTIILYICSTFSLHAMQKDPLEQAFGRLTDAIRSENNTSVKKELFKMKDRGLLQEAFAKESSTLSQLFCKVIQHSMQGSAQAFIHAAKEFNRLKFLLLKCDIIYRSPLMLAVITGNYELTKTILNASVDANCLKECVTYTQPKEPWVSDNSNILHVIAELGSKATASEASQRIIPMLCDYIHSTKSFTELCNARDINGHTPAEIACINNNAGLMPIFSAYTKAESPA